MNNSLVQTKTPVVYGSTGQYVYADTAIGALSAASVEANFLYNLTKSGSVWTIDNIGSVTSGYTWYVYVDGTLTGTTLSESSISTGTSVGFCYLPTGTSITKFSVAKNRANCIAYIKTIVMVQSAPMNIYTGTVTLESDKTFNTTISGYSFTGIKNTTVLNAIMTAARNTPGYTYDLGAYSYGGDPYAWINSLNNSASNWDQLGDGYTIAVERAGSTMIPAASIEKFELQNDDNLVIYVTSSSSGGSVSGLTPVPVGVVYDPASPWATTYYINNSAAKFTLDVTVV